MFKGLKISEFANCKLTIRKLHYYLCQHSSRHDNQSWIFRIQSLKFSFRGFCKVLLGLELNLNNYQKFESDQLLYILNLVFEEVVYWKIGILNFLKNWNFFLHIKSFFLIFFYHSKHILFYCWNNTLIQKIVTDQKNTLCSFVFT